jgi:hypothetical protein
MVGKVLEAVLDYNLVVLASVLKPNSYILYTATICACMLWLDINN